MAASTRRGTKLVCPSGNTRTRATRGREGVCICSQCLEYRNSRKSEFYYLLTNAKKRANDLGLPFTIDASDVVVPLVCPVLGIPLFRNKGSKGQGSNSPSLDRIIPQLGYVKGNVIVMSSLANRIKNDSTPNQVMAVALWFAKAVQ